MDAHRLAPPHRASAGGVLIPVGPWLRITRHADRLNLSAEEVLDLALDFFEEHGDAWLEVQRWCLDLDPAEVAP